MIIKELEIQNFGKFQNENITFREGINLVCGGNEAGKTTVYHCLKGMLFGIERGRGRAAGHDTYTAYEPWENKSWYAGTLRFTAGGRNFRIDRHFDRVNRQASLVCEDDGEEMSLEQGDLSMILDGLTESGFDNTMAVGQLCAEPDGTLSDALRNYAANYYGSGSGEINVAGALKQLKADRKETDAKVRELEQAWQRSRERCEERLDTLRTEEIRAAEEIADRKRLISEAEARTPEMSEISFRSRLLPTVLGFVSILLSICCMIFKMPNRYLLGGLLGGVGIILLLIVVFGRKEDLIEEKDRTESTLRSLSERIGQLKGQLQQLESDSRDRRTEISNLEESLSEQNDIPEELAQLRIHDDALAMAAERITEVSASLRKQFGTHLNNKISTIMAEITDGKYTSLVLEENGDIFINTPRKRIPAEQVSRGTCEQIYFSMRMAALDILYGNDLPVILDDTFAYYDDDRLAATLSWLGTHIGQVILFSCQDRELRLINENKIPCACSLIQLNS